MLPTPFHLFKVIIFFHVSVLTQEKYTFSNLDLLLSKEDITEDDLFQLRDLLTEETETSPIKTSLTNELANLLITPTNKPRIAQNSKNQISLHGTSSKNRKRAKKQHLDIALLEIHGFNLV